MSRMKRLPFLLVLFALLTVNNHLLAQSGADTIKTHISGILNKWHNDASQANHEAYIGAMAPDGVYIGTDASEHWSVAEFSKWSKPYFDRKHTWHFTAFNRHLYLAPDGTTAWFDELLITQMGVCRGSGVLSKQDGQWKIAQYVLSAAIPNEVMKTVTALKWEADTAVIFKSFFDKAGLTGTIMILDPEKNRTMGYQPALWDSGYLPASTFKIPNTLIGLEAGVIDTGYIFRWKGEKRRLPQWERDLTLTEAFRVSCVPCYQEIARKTGLKRMNGYLSKLRFGAMDVNAGNLDLFWLEGSSRITPRQQVDFLERLYREELPLKKSVMQAVRRIMVNEVTAGYTLSGKTGWAVRNGNNYGWFVGWIETKGKVYFIATLVEPKNQEMVDDFAMARKTVTMEVMRFMGIIK